MKELEKYNLQSTGGYLERSQWLKATWQQLEKDVYMSGIQDFPGEEPADLEKAITILSEFLQGLREQRMTWENLCYRVDLPSKVRLEPMDTVEIAHLFLVRSFQKVWLRKQYAETGGNTPEDRG